MNQDDTKRSFKILREQWITNFIVFYTPKNFYLLNELNDYVDLLLSSGIMNRIISTYLDNESKFFKAKLENFGPTGLSMANLQSAFNLWLYGIGVAALVAVLEALTKLKAFRQFLEFSNKE